MGRKVRKKGRKEIKKKRRQGGWKELRNRLDHYYNTTQLYTFPTTHTHTHTHTHNTHTHTHTHTHTSLEQGWDVE